MFPRTQFIAAAVGALGVVTPERTAAQFADPPPPAAYALQGITLVDPDGEMRAGVTVVIRGPMIEAIGPDVPIPPDAMVLEGDSLWMYPGLVDAQGKAKYEFPEPEVDRSEIESWDPPRAVQSFMPHRRVIDHLSATGSDLKADRQRGIVAAAVHPEGRLMPGRGVLLLLRGDASTPARLVVNPELGPLFSFQGAQGVYPGQHFAVLAFLRQTFEDVRREGLVQQAYATDPEGMTTPRWDPDYAVLQQVLNGAQPVFFAANSAADIRQVVELADAYGFRPFVVGGAEAWKVSDLLRQKNIPVLVSTDFPEPDRWDPKKDTTEASLDAAALREKQRLEATYANASKLAAAGVTFALTSGGGEVDLREGARKAIEYGLSEDAALRAVTHTPARLLGLPQVAEIGSGRAATFIVMTGPVFDEDSDVAYTFVEGVLERGKRAVGEPAGDSDEPAANIAGEWSWEMSIMGETRRGRAEIEQEGNEFSGSMTIEEGTLSISDGSVTGNRISFVVSFDAGGQMLEISYTGTVEGAEMRGEMSMEFGSGTWKATRISTPGEGGTR